MHMTFWWGAKLDHFLFYGINIEKDGGLLLCCATFAGLAFLFEWLKLLQARHKQKELVLRSKQLKYLCPVLDTKGLITGTRRTQRRPPIQITTKYKIFLCMGDIFFWLSIHNLGYIMMLAVMMYNGYLFVSVIIGAGVGYLAFGQRFMKINVENCHVIRDSYCMYNTDTESPVEGESTPAMQQATISGTSQSNTSVHVQVHNDNVVDSDNEN